MKRRIRRNSSKLTVFRFPVDGWQYKEYVVQDYTSPIPVFYGYSGWIPCVKPIKLVVCKAT